MQDQFIIASDLSFRIVWWTAFDGLTIKVHIYAAVQPVDFLGLARRDEDLTPRPPVAGVGNELAKGPSATIYDEIVDVADLAALGLDVWLFGRLAPAFANSCGNSLDATYCGGVT